MNVLICLLLVVGVSANSLAQSCWDYSQTVGPDDSCYLGSRDVLRVNGDRLVSYSLSGNVSILDIESDGSLSLLSNSVFPEGITRAAVKGSALYVTDYNSLQIYKVETTGTIVQVLSIEAAAGSKSRLTLSGDYLLAFDTVYSVSDPLLPVALNSELFIGTVLDLSSFEDRLAIYRTHGDWGKAVDVYSVTDAEPLLLQTIWEDSGTYPGAPTIIGLRQGEDGTSYISSTGWNISSDPDWIVLRYSYAYHKHDDDPESRSCWPLDTGLSIGGWVKIDEGHLAISAHGWLNFIELMDEGIRWRGNGIGTKAAVMTDSGSLLNLTPQGSVEIYVEPRQIPSPAIMAQTSSYLDCSLYSVQSYGSHVLFKSHILEDYSTWGYSLNRFDISDSGEFTDERSVMCGYVSLLGGNDMYLLSEPNGYRPRVSRLSHPYNYFEFEDGVNVRDGVISGEYVIVADGLKLQFYRIEDERLALERIQDTGEWECRYISSFDMKIYVTASRKENGQYLDHKVLVYDISNISEPELVESVSARTSGGAEVVGRLLYVGYSSDPQIFEIGPDGRLSEATGLPSEWINLRMVVNGDMAYQFVGDEIVAMDIADPWRPVMLGRVVHRGPIREMVQANGYLVVLDEFGFMTYSLDCRDPLPIEIAGPSPGSQTKANKLSVSPNPFNPMTEMVFNLDAPSDVTLRVFDLSGRLVRELSRGAMSKGLHSVVWNGKDDAGCPMSAGVYVGRLDVGDRVFSQKLSLIK